jgi:hypothetical protein
MGKQRRKLDLTNAQPAARQAGAASGDGASPSQEAAAAQDKAKQELKGEGTGRRGKRTRPQTPPPAETTTTAPAKTAADATQELDVLIGHLRKAQLAGQVTQNPYAVRDAIYDLKDKFPEINDSVLFSAATTVDPQETARGGYDFLKGEAEAVAAEGGDPPPPPPPSAVADSGTQTNLQDGVVTSSDESLPPVTDEQGQLTGEQVAERLSGMLGDAVAPAKIAVTSTKFPAYADMATPLPRRAAQPTPEQAAANVVAEAAAADMDADQSAEIARLNAALDDGTASVQDYQRLQQLMGEGGDLDESDLQRIIGDIELDESVVEPPPPFQPAPEPVPPEAQLGPRTEPAVPYPMESISVSPGDAVPSQPVDLSGLTNPTGLQNYRVQANLMGQPEGAEPVDVQAYLQALLTDKNLIADKSLQADPRFGQDQMFEPVVPDMSGVQRGQRIDSYTVGSGMGYDTPTVARSTTRTDVSNAPRVPTSSIRKLIDAANKNRVLTGGLGAMGVLGAAQAYNIATRKPPEEAQPVVNLDQEEEGLTPEEFAVKVRQRNQARKSGAGGLMTNVMEDRP